VRRLLLVAALILLAAGSMGRTEDPAPRPGITDEEKQIVELTNKERAEEKLPPYKINATLCKVARAHSENMAKQGKMSHELDGKNPSKRLTESGYAWQKVGENIARGEDIPAEALMKGWMESQRHRDNILNKEFTEIGVGLVHKDKEIYYTQVFARPLR
jgi:uncharacterized protein YkwD